MTLLKKISRRLASHLGCAWLPLKQGQGVVSFTFDDVPASACILGKQLLEEFDARGTFFVCGDLTDGQEQGHPCHSVEALQHLVEDGHEVGCHTFSHTNCATHSVKELKRDWEKNQDFFTKNTIANKGFAFPFGAYDLGSKLAASQRFAYNRITGGGTQTGRADLAALRAQSLYANKTSLDKIKKLIDKTAQQGGWLIFYSHEVDETPGPWGTTPAQLRYALAQAKISGCQILSVRDAILFFQR
ncbi:polysaccharide deacetylase family protein [Undibacterium sp. Jales W-56]|uniref:polysaccharide deacetylase family protein n=1 Tax=Undibacterium sp. Jales W-56 TaxID=2897325 RepID=UPI0021CFA406|nr:polysaccharide deacetylase family protein [Undibacterium sp. Jales W-56]MCU6433409.1 polysaccharide deacetylase family protein [Undibacterium sp. Jales W-56]